MNLFEKQVSHKEYDLAAKFAHFNKLCFGGSLPTIPCMWKKLKNKAGYCHIPFTVPPQYRNQPKIVRVMHGQAIVENMYIALDRQYLREEQNMDGILIHEMIHAWFAVQNDLLEDHGPKFMAKLKECSAISGIEVPRSESVEGLQVADDINMTKPYVVMIVERDDKTLYAIINHKTFDAIAHTASDMLRRLMKGSVITLYGTNSKEWNEKALKTKVQRPKSFPNTTLYVLQQPELLDDLKTTGKVLFTGKSE